MNKLHYPDYCAYFEKHAAEVPRKHNNEDTINLMIQLS